jgi:hypothetical protein
MTQRANPSVNRPLEAFKTAGAIALAGGSEYGWISPPTETSDISVQDPAIKHEKLNAFEESSTTDSLTVSIDPGEGFVFGSWVVKDTITEVNLAPNTSDQTIYLGWNNNEANDVIIGPIDNFNTGPNDTDQKIKLYEYDTDSSGVSTVTDNRRIGKAIDSNSITIAEKLGLPVYSDSSNAPVEQGTSIYIDGESSEREGIYVYDGSQWDRVARSDEELEDLVDALLAGGTGVTLSYDDSNSTLTIDGATQYTDELAQDAVNALLVAGNGISLTYDDANDEMTVEIPSGAVQVDEIDEAISPTWTGTHTFNNPVQQQSAPSADNELATKSYVDSTDQGLDIKRSSRVASTGSIDLTSSTDPNPIDGVTLNDGERILLKDQTDATNNGVYTAVTATDPTTWSRASDADTDSEVTDGFFTFIEQGTVQQGQGYVLLNNPTLGTDALNFTQFSDSGTLGAGDALVKSADTINHADTSNQNNVSAADGSAITDLNVDDYGHTTNISTTDLDQRYVESSGSTGLTGTLTVSGEIDASDATEIINATYTKLSNAQNATLSDGAIIYISDENSLYIKDSNGLQEIPTFEVIKTWVNNNASVPEADVARGFEARTDYPSNPDSGRVVFRTDKT